MHEHKQKVKSNELYTGKKRDLLTSVNAILLLYIILLLNINNSPTFYAALNPLLLLIKR